MAALNNIQASSRAYGRNRRRGLDANEDPAFRAAVEIADPEQRRAALAQYARERANALFATPADPGATSGRDIVNRAFPGGDAFADVTSAARPVQQADLAPAMPPASAAAAGAAMAAMDPWDRMDEANARADDLRIEAQDPTLDAVSNKPPVIPRTGYRPYSEAAEMETPAEQAAEPVEPDPEEMVNTIRARRRR